MQETARPYLSKTPRGHNPLPFEKYVDNAVKREKLLSKAKRPAKRALSRLRSMWQRFEGNNVNRNQQIMIF